MSAPRKRKGQTVTPAQKCWYDMIGRCYKPDHARYPEYGGRGIRVCDAWLPSAPMGREAFVEHMGPKPDGHVLGRHNTAGNYEPGNVAWMPRSKAARNQVSTLKITTSTGDTVALIDAAEHSGQDGRRVRRRIQESGWTLEEALTRTQPKYRRLTEPDVIRIRERRAAGASCATLAREYGVSANLISQIARGLKWKNIPMPKTVSP